MINNSTSIVDEIYKDMLAANRKSEEALFNYNRRVKEVTDDEIDKTIRLNLAKELEPERIKARKENDEEAKNHFRAYSFWNGELSRYSTLLQGIAAYKSMFLRAPRDPARSSPIDFSPR